MRTSTILAASAALIASTAAAPYRNGAWGYGRAGAWHPGTPGQQPDQCLSDADAAEAAEIFRQLIQNYSDELALEALTEEFVDYSSAVNIIRNRGAGGPIAVNGPSFVGRQAFMDAQGSQPEVPFTTLGVWHGCNSTSMRWQTERSANGQPAEVSAIPVVGNAVMETVPDSNNSYGFRIKVLYSEFNAAAWLVNLGVFTPAAQVANATTQTGKRDVEDVSHLI